MLRERDGKVLFFFVARGAPLESQPRSTWCLLPVLLLTLRLPLKYIGGAPGSCNYFISRGRVLFTLAVRPSAQSSSAQSSSAASIFFSNVRSLYTITPRLMTTRLLIVASTTALCAMPCTTFPTVQRKTSGFNADTTAALSSSPLQCKLARIHTDAKPLGMPLTPKRHQPACS